MSDPISTPSTRLDSLPLLHDGDAFVLELEIWPSHVQLLSILRYSHNQNVEASHERFRDLDPFTKRAVIQQINRRWKGKMVKV